MPTDQARKSPSPANALERISIVTRSAWEVMVRPDGCGHVGFILSAAPDSTVIFPKGTLDFEQIRKALRARDEEVASPTIQVHVALPRPGQTSAPRVRRSVSLSWAESLFRKVLSSVGSKPALFKHYEKEYPVFPRTRPAMPPANSKEGGGSEQTHAADGEDNAADPDRWKR